jgi:hypothetical protein
MAITRLNNNSITSVTALPSGIDVGKVGQITQGTLGSRVTSTSTSASATGLITSITPSSTNSKIYLMVNLGGIRMSTNTYMGLWLYRQINSGGYSELRKLENGMGFINGSSIQTWGKAQNYLERSKTMTDIATAIQSLNKKGGNSHEFVVEVSQLMKQNTTVVS